jgi:hypothetical protein
MQIFYMGRRVDGRFDSLKAKCKRAVRVIGWSMLNAYRGLHPHRRQDALDRHGHCRETTAQLPVQAPVLDHIADCESGNGKPGSARQFKADGSVVVNTNTNGIVDVGKYQINMSADHIKEMAKLGFNPLTEDGNKAYAEWLYTNRGTGDWSSSAHCWQK